MTQLTLSQEIARLEYKVLVHRSDGPEPDPGQFMAAYEQLQSIFASLPQAGDDLPFTDPTEEEVTPPDNPACFTVAIDGHKVPVAMTYDDADRWLGWVQARFPEAQSGIVYA